MEKIERKITVEMTIDEAAYINELIERDKAVMGIPHEGYKTLNYCPICNSAFSSTDNFCDKCGRRVRFTDSDIVPL